jgi:hypothetical protein
MSRACLVLNGLLLAACACACRPRLVAAAEAGVIEKPNSTKIMFLGVYHMNNPGLDDDDVVADDVLLPKRQQELEEVVGKLAHFEPTKICIEAAYRSTTWHDRYQQYLIGDYRPGRTEIEQIGFPLAKRLGLKTLYGFDYPMYMSGLTPSELEFAKPEPSKIKMASRSLSKDDRLLQKSTVGEFLLYLNSEDWIQTDHRRYLMQLLPSRDAAIYAKTDALTNWYKHNLRMFTNLNRIVEPDKDRVLVIVGSGHLKLLRDFAHDAPYFSVVDAREVLTP